ncbi:efflux RND transporter periplasmic adaptor subunit [Chitiniphilus eburneus]|uniref:Efflux RND transporter periplasmic adaptor subunit n=1 Tax=Chitiniphilus eburneus TaxID=2571148 RepID=A0A4V5MQU9_9NEIS|nr:efflux RND transporter periplasmic adaptor subunit [Chitiniphilus eburneus]TJZ73218.1 efflux RND transporter periplasmic adaptor subunit [Chitiniphilus eburneus]
MTNNKMILATILVALLSACSKTKEEPNKSGPPKVAAVEAEQRDVPVTLSAQGNVVPINQVDIRPKVSSTIRTVEISEGQNVKAGQLLFTLDSREDETVLQRSAALIRKTEADLVLAQQTLRRNQELAKSGFISPSAVDTAQSQVDSLRADLAAARSDLNTNTVKVSYNRITAPFAGRAGAIAVHPGSLVQPGSAEPMLTLVQLDPIQIEFTAPERDLPLLLATQAKGNLVVRARLADGGERAGRVVFIDNTVDRNAGTIKLKAEFANADHQLWPGLFARVEVDAGVQRNAVLIPAEAVINGPDRRFVYVVQADDTVKDQTVTIERIVNERAVVEGLPAGSKVISEGGQNLRPGTKVTVTRAATAPRDATASTPRSAAASEAGA